MEAWLEKHRLKERRTKKVVGQIVTDFSLYANLSAVNCTGNICIFITSQKNQYILPLVDKPWINKSVCPVRLSFSSCSVFLDQRKLKT